MSVEFSIFLAVALGVLSVVFFVGKGNAVIEAFQGKNAPKRKKKSPEDERRYQRAFGVFCLLLMINEILMIFLAPLNRMWNIVSIVFIVIIFIGIIIYLKKNFPEG
jgi:uncharacterized membrane protein